MLEPVLARDCERQVAWCLFKPSAQTCLDTPAICTRGQTILIEHVKHIVLHALLSSARARKGVRTSPVWLA